MNNLPSEYEKNQYQKTLTWSIWVIIAATLFFGGFNLNLSSQASALVIFAATASCLLAQVANFKKHPRLAALMVCASVLITVTFSVYDGDGLFDPGVIGYTLFILVGTLLLSKKYTLWLTLAAILALALVSYLQSIGMIHPTIRLHDPSNFVPITAFLVSAALIVWVILGNLDKNMDRLRWSEAQMRESYALTIQGWGKAMELRDNETARHSEEVVQLSEDLATRMGLPPEQIEQVRYGAQLHDIGKLAIPDEILLKPGPLSPEEWVVMREHTTMAKKMLEGIPYLQNALDIPYAHHERWDGSGYPLGADRQQHPVGSADFRGRGRVGRAAQPPPLPQSLDRRTGEILYPV